MNNKEREALKIKKNANHKSLQNKRKYRKRKNIKSNFVMLRQADGLPTKTTQKRIKTAS